MAKPTLENKDILTPLEAIELFQLCHNKFYRFLKETDGGDFLAFYKTRCLILRVAFERYLHQNPDVKEALSNGKGR